MSDELAKLSRAAIGLVATNTLENDNFAGPGKGAWVDEINERTDAWRFGAPGRAPMLSRAQCKAVLGPLLQPRATWHNHGIHAAARALLHLGPDEKSPLEED